MKKKRSLIPLSLVWLLVLSLLAGCYLPAAPNVTPTPSQQELEEAGMATMAAQAAQSPQPESPTSPPPTLETFPSPTPESVLPTVPPAETPIVLPVETPTISVVIATPTAEIAPSPAQGAAVSEAAIPSSSAETTYTVQPGDRLYRIALRFGVDYRVLAAHNNIVNPNLIYPGQVLRIPATGQPPAKSEIWYTVQPGDNLFRIALRYNMNYLYLASYNGITNPHQIRVGQVIRIPVIP